MTNDKARKDDNINDLASSYAARVTDERAESLTAEAEDQLLEYAHDDFLAGYKARDEEVKKLVDALNWISGRDIRRHCVSYYERVLDDGRTVPPYFEIAENALKEFEGENENR